MEKRLFILLLVVLPIIIQPLGAQHWVTIAEKTVDFKSDKDEVLPHYKEKKVDKIRLKCVQGSVRINEVQVEMSDGRKESYDAKGIGMLTKGVASFPWDLPGKNGYPSLTKIILLYDSLGNMAVSKKAKVEIQGKLVADKN